VARAPGRLDVMGGIADYSGSLVLQVRACCCLGEGDAAACAVCAPACQPTYTTVHPTQLGDIAWPKTCCHHLSPQMPLAEACHVAVQRQPAAAAGAGRLRIASLNAEAAGRGPAFEMDLAELVSGRRQRNSKHARWLQCWQVAVRYCIPCTCLFVPGAWCAAARLPTCPPRLP
jgi:hypothetical protein